MHARGMTAAPSHIGLHAHQGTAPLLLCTHARSCLHTRGLLGREDAASWRRKAKVEDRGAPWNWLRYSLSSKPDTCVLCTVGAWLARRGGKVLQSSLGSRLHTSVQCHSKASRGRGGEAADSFAPPERSEAACSFVLPEAARIKEVRVLR